MGLVNFKSRKALYSIAIIGIISLILFGLYIFASDQVPSFNLASMATLKVSAIDTPKPEQECLDIPDGYEKWSCLGPYFEKLTIEKSTQTALTEALKFKTQGIVSDCHLFAHNIGEKSLENHNFDLGKAFSSCSHVCSKGCWHGVIERYINEQQILPEIKNICDGVGLDYYQRIECIHGIGHGLLSHNYLPVTDAIYACKTLGSLDQVCFGGLTMGRMDQYLSLNLAESDLKKILPEVCDPFESVEPGTIMDICILYVAEGLLYYTGYEIERTEELCEGLQQQYYINRCKNLIPLVISQQRPSNIDINQFLIFGLSKKLCEGLPQQEQIDHCKRIIHDTILLEKPLNIDINEVLLNH